MKRVAWGILGCGNIATKAIAPAIRWSSNGRLVAIASRDPGAAKRKADELGAERAHAGYEALLADEEIDAIYIGLPNGLHEEWALRAAAANKHVLCEKSLALSFESAQRMATAFAERGLRLVEAFMYRHHPQWNVVRRLLADGTIGDVRMIRSSLSGHCPAGDHRWSHELGGGALYDVVCYAVDVARYLLGTEPEHTHAFGGLDGVSAILEFPGRVLANAAGSFALEHEQHLAILGTDGRIDVEKPFIPGWTPTVLRVTRASDVERIEVGGANHFLHQVEHFASLVQDRSRPLAPAENGVANAGVLAAIMESLRGAGDRTSYTMAP
jgi:predicted dehydrogenase